MTDELQLELPNINENKIPSIERVDSDGKQLGVIDRLKALEIASQRELDLVLVSEKQISCCRIMDYGKYKFEQERKLKKQGKSHQTEVKEVKMRYKIDKKITMSGWAR